VDWCFPGARNGALGRSGGGRSSEVRGPVVRYYAPRARRRRRGGRSQWAGVKARFVFHFVFHSGKQSSQMQLSGWEFSKVFSTVSAWVVSLVSPLGG
jgi:hypothetical protein